MIEWMLRRMLKSKLQPGLVEERRQRGVFGKVRQPQIDRSRLKGRLLESPTVHIPGATVVSVNKQWLGLKAQARSQISSHV
jgi:hypothetical protein